MSAPVIQAYGKKMAEKYGYIHRKFEINSGDPDEMFAKFGFVFLVEIKYGTDTVKPHQARQHKLWRKMGFLVFIVSDNSEWEAVFDEAERVRTQGVSKKL